MYGFIVQFIRVNAQVICDKINHSPNVQAQCDKKKKKNIGSMFRLNVQVICDKEKIGSMCRLSVQAQSLVSMSKFNI